MKRDKWTSPAYKCRPENLNEKALLKSVIDYAVKIDGYLSEDEA